MRPVGTREQEIQQGDGGGGWGSSGGGQSGGRGKVRAQSGEPSVLLPEEVSAIRCGGLDLGRREVHGGPAGDVHLPAADPQTAQPGRPGRGLGSGGRDAGERAVS